MNSTASEPSPSSSRVLTVPNAISAARIASIPVFVALILDHDTTTAGLILFPMVSWGSLGLPLAATATVGGWAAYAVGIVEYYVAAFAYLGDIRRASYRGAGSEDGDPAR